MQRHLSSTVANWHLGTTGQQRSKHNWSWWPNVLTQERKELKGLLPIKQLFKIWRPLLYFARFTSWYFLLLLLFLFFFPFEKQEACTSNNLLTSNLERRSFTMSTNRCWTAVWSGASFCESCKLASQLSRDKQNKRGRSLFFIIFVENSQDSTWSSWSILKILRYDGSLAHTNSVFLSSVWTRNFQTTILICTQNNYQTFMAIHMVWNKITKSSAIKMSRIKLNFYS